MLGPKSYERDQAERVFALWGAKPNPEEVVFFNGSDSPISETFVEVGCAGYTIVSQGSQDFLPGHTAKIKGAYDPAIHPVSWAFRDHNGCVWVKLPGRELKKYDRPDPDPLPASACLEFCDEEEEEEIFA